MSHNDRPLTKWSHDELVDAAGKVRRRLGLEPGVRYYSSYVNELIRRPAPKGPPKPRRRKR